MFLQIVFSIEAALVNLRLREGALSSQLLTKSRRRGIDPRSMS